HALWTLEGMHNLTPALIGNAFHDPEPGVRENAIKLAELHLGAWPDLLPALLGLKRDTSEKVRYQLLCTLGSVNTPEAGEARQELLFKDINDEWVQVAALSASSSGAVDMMNAILLKFEPGIPAYASLVRRLGAMISASQNAKVIHTFLQKAVDTVWVKAGGWQAPLLEGLAEGLKS